VDIPKIMLAIALTQTPHLPQKDVRVWQKSPAKPPANSTFIGCTRHDAGQVIAHYNRETKKMDPPTEVEDWKVECTVKVGIVTIWHSDDIISRHPISLKDAQAEIAVFITDTGNELVLEYLRRAKAAEKPNAH
jgi:hypothetical protein